MIVLELFKYTIPAIIVFLTAYLILKNHHQNERMLRAMEYKSQTSGKNLGLKMQAYERLALFCERISIPNLLIRLKSDQMNGNQLKQSLILVIQQEYEHNFSQQIYVSDALWQIISLCKNQVVEIINLSDHKNLELISANDYVQMMLENFDNMRQDPTRTGLEAIKKEVKLYI